MFFWLYLSFYIFMLMKCVWCVYNILCCNEFFFLQNQLFFFVSKHIYRNIFIGVTNYKNFLRILDLDYLSIFVSNKKNLEYYVQWNKIRRKVHWNTGFYSFKHSFKKKIMLKNKYTYNLTLHHTAKHDTPLVKYF